MAVTPSYKAGAAWHDFVASNEEVAPELRPNGLHSRIRRDAALNLGQRDVAYFWQGYGDQRLKWMARAAKK